MGVANEYIEFHYRLENLSSCLWHRLAIAGAGCSFKRDCRGVDRVIGTVYQRNLEVYRWVACEDTAID